MLNKFLSENPRANFVFQVAIAFISSTIFGFAMKFFLIPGNIFSAGVPGLAQLVRVFVEPTPLAAFLTTGNLYFLINVPILILAYLKLGHQFTFLTITVVVFTTIMTNFFPVTVISENPMINAIVGGTLVGFAGGITIKYGMSGGGFDIITIIMSRAFGINVGVLNVLVNSFIVFGSGFLYDWEIAIFTMISIYVSSRVIDTIHTGEQRLTAFIVTHDPASVTASIRSRLVRSSTILDARGGYTGDKRDVIMIVINRYELHELQMAILDSDPTAFVNIIQSTKVLGQFLSKDQQQQLRKQYQNQSKVA